MMKTVEQMWTDRLAAMPFLGDTERRVIAARLGDHGHARSVGEVAILLNLPREVVTRTEAVVTCKLDHPSTRGCPGADGLRRSLARLPR